jgi:hypothetical protein
MRGTKTSDRGRQSPGWTSVGDRCGHGGRELTIWLIALVPLSSLCYAFRFVFFSFSFSFFFKKILDPVEGTQQRPADLPRRQAPK